MKFAPHVRKTRVSDSALVHCPDGGSTILDYSSVTTCICPLERILRRGHQFRRHGIFLDIGKLWVAIGLVTQIVIEGLVLRSNLSTISLAERPAAEAQSAMNMVWHNYPGAKFIEAPLAINDRKGVRDEIGDATVFEP